MIEEITKDGAKGHCDLCGEWFSALNHVAIWDFVGWVCPDCQKHILDSYSGRFRAASAQSEPAE